MRSILEGERSPRADVVALNAALALLVGEHVESLLEGLLRARKSLADGSARAVFDAVRGRPQAEDGDRLNDILQRLYAAKAVALEDEKARE